jgi:hypothetical protein
MVSEPGTDMPAVAVASDAPDAGVPTRSMLATLRGIGALVAPTTLVTALLYYFGWTRTSKQAFVMGLDDSLFGYSASDYILRSITSMFWPLFYAALVILAGVFAHARLLAWADERALRTVTLAVAATAGILLLLGLVGSGIDRPSRFVSLTAPMAITVGIALLAYVAYLHQIAGIRVGGQGALTGTPLGAVGWGAVTVLLLLSSFWTVSHYAAIKGIDFARSAVQQLPAQPSVTIYSPSRLYLEHPVVEEVFRGEQEAAYRFKYSGLKLLFRADGKLFLRPSDLDDPRNIVIAEDTGIRVEYE